MARFKRGKLVETVKIEILTGDKTLQALVDFEVQSLNPNGADRVITLPMAGSSSGFGYKIINSGTDYNLIIKDSNNNIITTIIPSSMVSFTCDKNKWRSLKGYTGGTGGSGGTGATGATGGTGATGATGASASNLSSSSNGYGTRYVSTAGPSGGVDGDIWMVVT